MTEMASAPTAGANGVDPEEPAPMAHAMNRLAPPATRNVATVPAPTMSSGFPEAGLITCRTANRPESGAATTAPPIRLLSRRSHPKGLYSSPGCSERELGMQVLQRLKRLAGRTGKSEPEYVCQDCGTGFEVQRQVCPSCEGYYIDRREW
jgi:hypothetical protein